MAMPAKIEDRQTVPLKIISRTRKPKMRYVLIGVLLFLFLGGSISGVMGYFLYSTYNGRYQTDLALAKSGLQQMQKAEGLLKAWSQHPLDAELTSQAESDFLSASKSFGQLNRDLQSLPQFITQVPSYGAKLNTALHLIPLAITLSQIGISASRILNTFDMSLHNPLSSQGQGLTASDLVNIALDVKALNSLFASVNDQISTLQPGDMQFDSRIPALVSTFHKDAPMIQEWLDAIKQLLPVAPALLGVGNPTNYLIEVLDSTELRPGGGFIGNYGTATFSGGRLTSNSITDAYLLDRAFEGAGKVIPFPASYAWFNLSLHSWSFRDSNLDADFPTAARYAEEIYREEGGTVPVQGVLALTPALLEQMLKITGPISVPEYHETITAQNIIARIHYYQLGGTAAGEGSDIPSPDGLSSVRKHFIALLAEHLLTRVRQLPSSDLSGLLLVVIHSVASKDLQIYLNSSVAENLLHRFHLDASIQSPDGDSLFVVDANIAGNKANNFIATTMDDHVTVDSQGNGIQQVTLKYAWTIPGQDYGNPLYRDYVRVYVPSGSVLLSQSGWQSAGTGKAFNRDVWAGMFTLSYGETRTMTLVWKVPEVASEDRSGWHYQYLVQRQAGILWKLNLQIALPGCAVVINKWGGLVSKGRQEEHFNNSLIQDLSLGTEYTCK